MPPGESKCFTLKSKGFSKKHECYQQEAITDKSSVTKYVGLVRPDE